jgi:hypothetical protein
VVGKECLGQHQKELSGLTLVVQVEPIDVDDDDGIFGGQVKSFAAKAEDGAVVPAELAEQFDRLCRKFSCGDALR